MTRFCKLQLYMKIGALIAELAFLALVFNVVIFTSKRVIRIQEQSASDQLTELKTCNEKPYKIQIEEVEK